MKLKKCIPKISILENDYYQSKLHFSIDTEEGKGDLIEMTKHYIEGLQVLLLSWLSIMELVL